MDDEYNYWSERPSPPPASAPALTVEIIEGVEPLNTQFGEPKPPTVPVALQGAMFGQSAPKEGEEAADATNVVGVPPLHTYAILDAAKLTNLPEMLETSGLPHRCLFKGAAYNELKEVAPWIVRLEDGHAFTRNIFTTSDAPWHLWKKDPAIFLRSPKPLEYVHRHLRKFTQLRTETGHLEYFRFWESSVLDYIAFFEGEDLGCSLFPDMIIIWQTRHYSRGPRFVKIQTRTKQ